MFATFTGTLAGSIPSMTDNQEVILIEKEQGASIRKMISSTLRKYHQPTPDMKSLSSDCYNFLMNFTDCAASPKIQDNPLYQRYVIPVIKEIETGYQQDITAAQLSRSVFVSPQYLSRLFRRFMGCSVYEYVTMYRISRERELLLSRPDMKIKDVEKYYTDFFAGFDRAAFWNLIGKTGLDGEMKVRELSSGMNAKLRIAATLARKAKLTLLDEPLNGVDFKAREQIVEMILRQADESRTIVMSTHLIEEIESYVEEAIFIKGGKLADVVNLERERMTTGRSLTELYMQLM